MRRACATRQGHVFDVFAFRSRPEAFCSSTNSLTTSVLARAASASLYRHDGFMESSTKVVMRYRDIALIAIEPRAAKAAA